MRAQFGLEKVRPGATVCPEKRDASQAFGSSPSSDPGTGPRKLTDAEERKQSL